MMHVSTASASLAALIVGDVTLVLGVALGVSAVVRGAASRHAVLLVALGVVGLSPLLVIGGRTAAWRWEPPPLRDAGTRWVGAESQMNFVAPRADWVSPAAVVVRREQSRPRVADVLGIVWLVGVAIGIVRLICGIGWMRRMRRDATALPAEMLARSHAVPPVYCSDAAAVPMLIGIWRPMIVIPRKLIGELESEQLRQVVLHECAHAARHDVVIGSYQRLLGIALWFHPLLHLANWQLDLAREELCDDAVLRGGEPAARYVRTLLAVAESASRVSAVAAGGYGVALGLIRPGSRLSRRVAEILNPRRTTMTRLSNWKRAMLGVNFALGAALVGGLGAGPATESADKRVPPADSEVSHVVPFVGMEDVFGRTQIGDALIITAVHGSTDKIAIGGIYRIDGAYTLASHDEAELSTSITVTKLPEPHLPPIAGHSCRIHRGSGTFTVYMRVGYGGYPHVSMNPIEGGGQSFGGEYFGTGEFVAPEAWRAKARMEESEASPADAPVADMSHSVPFVAVQDVFSRNLPGDAIIITAVHGTADAIDIDNTYQIEGSYTLGSHDDAELAAFGTATQPNEPHRQMIPGQTVMIHRGSGRFVLRLKVEDPQCPHVSFYPAGGGEGFGGEYFGTGDFVAPAEWLAK